MPAITENVKVNTAELEFLTLILKNIDINIKVIKTIDDAIKEQNIPGRGVKGGKKLDPSLDTIEIPKSVIKEAMDKVESVLKNPENREEQTYKLCLQFKSRTKIGEDFAKPLTFSLKDETRQQGLTTDPDNSEKSKYKPF